MNSTCDFSFLIVSDLFSLHEAGVEWEPKNDSSSLHLEAQSYAKVSGWWKDVEAPVYIRRQWLRIDEMQTLLKAAAEAGVAYSPSPDSPVFETTTQRSTPAAAGTADAINAAAVTARSNLPLDAGDSSAAIDSSLVSRLKTALRDFQQGGLLPPPAAVDREEQDSDATAMESEDYERYISEDDSDGEPGEVHPTVCDRFIFCASAD